MNTIIDLIQTNISDPINYADYLVEIYDTTDRFINLINENDFEGIKKLFKEIYKNVEFTLQERHDIHRMIDDIIDEEWVIAANNELREAFADEEEDEDEDEEEEEDDDKNKKC